MELRIRKRFIISSSSHIVKNCSSDRCRFSYHSHSPTIDVFLAGDDLDNAQMLVDFGLLKTFKKFLSIFNNTLMIWGADTKSFVMLQDYARCSNKDVEELRWVSLPFNPSAEMLAMYFHVVLNDIFSQTNFNNGESKNIRVDEVHYHETKSGKAISTYGTMGKFELKLDKSKIKVSPAIYKNDDELEMIVRIMNGDKDVRFNNPVIEPQVIYEKQQIL